MRPKDMNTGLRGGLFEAKHRARMGQAVWLFGWLVLRQTTERGATGLVLGGRPITYREIAEETGFNRRTLERWMRTLRHHGYIETWPSASAGAPTSGGSGRSDADSWSCRGRSALPGISVRILKAKKFGPRQRQLKFCAPGRCIPGAPTTPQVGAASPASELRGGLRGGAPGPTPICGAMAAQGIDLESVAGPREKGKTDIEKVRMPTLPPRWDYRRTIREEQARQEARVGMAPEAAEAAVRPEALERLRRRLAARYGA